MMKKNQIIRRTAPLVLVLATAPAVHATVTGAVPPVAVTWVNIADTAPSTFALDPVGVPIVAPVNFAKFDPPVVSQYSQGLAFKGWLAAPATPATDEGVWSTAPKLSSAGTPHIATLVLREADPVPPSMVATFGSPLNVENLQCASNDWTACMTNTSLGKVGIGFNSLILHNLGESVTSAWSDIRPPVITNFQTAGAFAIWKRDTSSPPVSGVRHLPIALPATALTPYWDTGFSGTYRPNQPPRIASPSISDGGWVAAYARDFAGTGAINNHIQLRSATGGPPSVIVRETTPALTPVPSFITAAARFGTIHNNLMANSDSVVAGSELVTWQMQTMRDPLVIPKTSLWCKHNGTYSCLAYQNQPAPDLPAGNTISSFYALHAVPDFMSPGDHWIFWGAMIMPGSKVAIYRTHVSTTAGLPDLIASSVAGTCPVNLISGGTQNITAIDRYFSVNIHGTVLFKATCALAPAGQRQILVTADVLSFHSRKVRAQSGVATAGVPVAGAFPPASNFQLATPEQGSCSRGQAIGTQWLAAKVLYNAGANQGVFWAFQ